MVLYKLLLAEAFDQGEVTGGRGDAAEGRADCWFLFCEERGWMSVRL